jgi:hypothetical protein
MGWIYSHLLSLGQVSHLSQRLGIKMAAAQEAKIDSTTH